MFLQYTFLIVETQSESHPIMPSTNKEITEENLETKEIFENREQEKINNEYSGHNFNCFVSIKNISLRPFLNWVVRREEHLASGLN